MDITGIQHVTFSTKGGAGSVASELNRGIILGGGKSRIISVTNGAIPDLKFRKPILVFTALFDYFIVRSKQCHQLFTLFRRFIRINGSAGKSLDNEITHLHWTPGVISIDEISKQLKSGSRIVWTLHDMWAFTGGCHFSDQCNEFLHGCTSCPQVKPIFRTAVQKSFDRKLQALQSTNNLEIVTPSNWLKAQAQASKILAEKQIFVIPNPIDCEVFKPNQQTQTRHTDLVIGCSAANLNETRKGIELFIKWTDDYISKFPDKKLSVLAVGSGQIISDRVEVRTTGFVSDKKELSDLYNQMDIFVSLATSDNFPLNIGEAVASGLPTICRDSGGMPELVDHGKTGFLVSNIEEFHESLTILINDRELRYQMGMDARLKALQEFDTRVVTNQYLQIYANI